MGSTGDEDGDEDEDEDENGNENGNEDENGNEKENDMSATKIDVANTTRSRDCIREARVYDTRIRSDVVFKRKDAHERFSGTVPIG